MNKTTSYWTWIFLLLALVFVVIVFLVIRKQQLSRDDLPPQEPLAGDVDSSVSSSTNQNTNTTGQSQSMVYGKAQVASVTIDIAESFPVQVFARITGNHPDGCTSIDTATPKVDANRKLIEVAVSTKRPATSMCTDALVPYTYSVSLPVTGLAAGTYTVLINGVTEMFILPSDNSLDFQGDKS